MKYLGTALVMLMSGAALAQAPTGTTEVTADSCKLYLPSGDAKGASRIRWSGQCKDGLADGRGIVRIYSGGKIARVSETTFAAGKVASAGEAYFIKGGQAVRSRGGDQLEIAASELPTWALELSMLVEDRPVRAAPPSKPAAPAKPAEQVAQEKAAAETERLARAKAAEEKAAADKAAAEAKRQAAEAEKLAKAKAAEEKAAAAKAAKEAEAKRIAAEKERAAAQAQASAEKRAAEKAAAEAKAAADTKAVAEAKAAAERAAAAERIAREKAAAEARAAAEAKAAAEARTAADAKAAADARAAEQAKAAAEAKAAVDAKAAMDKIAAERLAAQKSAPFVPGRGFGDGGQGEPLRAVVTFTLTTDDGRNLGIATFVAGKGEAAIKQNAVALAQTYEKVSPFHAKLLEQPTVITTCGGPGYVVEARVTYPATKTYGWFAGCMGDNIDGTAKAIQQIEDALHKDFKATPTSFWAYQYLIIGYVDEAGMRGRAEYERVARPNLMAPGRVMVLLRPDQWAECTTVANKDPKLKDKVACLKEAMEKLKPKDPITGR